MNQIGPSRPYLEIPAQHIPEGNPYLLERKDPYD